MIKNSREIFQKPKRKSKDLNKNLKVKTEITMIQCQT